MNNNEYVLAFKVPLKIITKLYSSYQEILRKLLTHKI